MAPAVAQRASDLLREPLPNMVMSNHHTTSSALHSIHFAGKLEVWVGFERDSRMACDSIGWGRQYRKVLGYVAKVRKAQHITNERVKVGCEVTVQGRFLQNVGQPMNTIFETTGINAWFNDLSSCATRAINGLTPDITIASTGDTMVVPGEIKVDWITDHDLGKASENTDKLRHVLGQIALYMKKYKLKYGFISTYKETIFLKQEYLSGEWTLSYSNPIQQDAESDPTNQTASLRECFYYLVTLALNGFFADNRQQGWVSVHPQRADQP